jgi:hypothetical protein
MFMSASEKDETLVGLQTAGWLCDTPGNYG